MGGRVSQDLENYLKKSLEKLEKAYQEVLKTQPYNESLERMKMLIELTKEQVQNEDSRNSTGQIG